MNRLAVLGHPVAHSRSPAMQTAALQRLGLAEEWSYEAIDVPPDRLAELVAALPRSGFVGANVTIPHKQAALDLADSPSAAAAEIGAANTLSFGDGSVRADNTDAPGLLAALPQRPGDGPGLVLGAGGSARAAVWALAREGNRVEVWNRTHSRAEELVESLSGAVSSDAPPPAAVDRDQALSGEYRLIVNCTAVGMAGGEDPFAELPLRPDLLGPGVCVVDLVYAGGETELLRAAAAAGAATVDGLEVLVRQGAESLRIWTGREPPLEVMREAARSGT